MTTIHTHAPKHGQRHLLNVNRMPAVSNPMWQSKFDGTADDNSGCFVERRAGKLEFGHVVGGELREQVVPGDARQIEGNTDLPDLGDPSMNSAISVTVILPSIIAWANQANTRFSVYIARMKCFNVSILLRWSARRRGAFQWFSRRRG